MTRKRTLNAGPTVEIPSWQDDPNLPTLVSNQKAGFASSCPLADLALYNKQFLFTLICTMISLTKLITECTYMLYHL